MLSCAECSWRAFVQDFADNVPLVLPKKKKAAEPDIESKKAAEPEIVPLQEGQEAAGAQDAVAPQIVPMVEDHMEVDRSHESIALPGVAASSMEHRPLLPTTMEVAASKPNQMQQGNAARGESVLSLPVHVGGAAWAKDGAAKGLRDCRPPSGQRHVVHEVRKVWTQGNVPIGQGRRLG